MSTIKTETLSTPSNATVPVDTVVNGTAKAWVNFNGTGTVAIRRAFNVSSITDNGTGIYAVNLTTAMPDTSYAAVATASYAGTANVYAQAPAYGPGGSNTTSIVRVGIISGTSVADANIINVTIFS